MTEFSCGILIDIRGTLIKNGFNNKLIDEVDSLRQICAAKLILWTSETIDHYKKVTQQAHLVADLLKPAGINDIIFNNGVAHLDDDDLLELHPVIIESDGSFEFYAKQDSKSYPLVAKKYGLTSMVLIDDNEKNRRAAEKAGYKAFDPAELAQAGHDSHFALEEFVQQAMHISKATINERRDAAFEKRVDALWRGLGLT